MTPTAPTNIPKLPTYEERVERQKQRFHEPPDVFVPTHRGPLPGMPSRDPRPMTPQQGTR